MKIPGKREWKDAMQGLDERYAYMNFFEKSLEEAQQLFVMNALSHQENLMWMPKKPFQFYLPAFIKYLKSKESEGDSDAASSFISLISHKIEFEKEDVTELWEEVRDTLEYIKDRQEWYDASEDIYGDFKAHIQTLYQQAEQDAAGNVATRRP